MFYSMDFLRTKILGSEGLFELKGSIREWIIRFDASEIRLLQPPGMVQKTCK